MIDSLRTALATFTLGGVLAFSLCTTAAAQHVGTCRPGEAWADLDANHVRARMYNTGTLFWRGSGAHYTVPQQSGVGSIFLATLQLGGLVGGEYRLVGSNYGPFEFWPGPLDDARRPPEDCSEYDRIYSIHRDSFVHFERTGEVTRDMLEWPVHLGAPVADGDGIPDNYNLSGGDRPALLGDQMHWWVMNDAGNKKRWMTSPPLPLELRMSAFSFNNLDVLRNHPQHHYLEQALRSTTFYRYQLHYLGDEPLEDAWFSIWTDLDSGVHDQYVGSDSSLGLGFAYKGRIRNGSDGATPDSPPPAIGFDFFRGPVIRPDSLDNDGDGLVDEADERSGATRFLMHSHGGDVMGWPYSPKEAYDQMRGIWRDGSPMTLGGMGYRGQTPVHFMFSGNPPAFWSEENVDGTGRSNTPGYRHFTLSTGPFRMEPGATEDIYLGIVWSMGRDRLDSVYKLKSDDALIQSVFEDLIKPYRPPPPPPPPAYSLVHHYPSPVHDRATIAYTLPRQEHVRLVVYDVLGREVSWLVDGIQPSGGHRVEFTVASLPSGVYFYEIQAGLVRGGRTMVVTR